MGLDNIFSPTFGNRPQTIVGRDEAIHDFERGLEGRPGHPNRASFFIGQRGMGKTALLLELADRAKDKGFVVVRSADSAKMLEEIIEGIQVAGASLVKAKDKPLKSVSAGALGFSIGLTFSDEVQKNYGFRTKLTLLIQKLAKHNKGVLFIIDEIQSNSPQMRELALSYQYLVGEGADIAFAMAGLPGSISAVLNDKVLTFLNRAHKTVLRELPINDIVGYYCREFSRQGVAWTPALVDSAATSTMGYPYLLQLVGYHIFELLGDTKELTRNIVDMAVLNSRRELVANVFSPILKPLSVEDRRFLDAMATDRGPSKISDIKARLGATDSHIQTYRLRMIDAGVAVSPQRGSLDIVVPYLKQHLRGEL
ncbi:MAG: ATP-binding protein [Coriobacteriales bacterium]|jgi:hypothetical protein|nr:ATP-binding protein [Coriobacteriales bacterium]